MNPQFRRDQDWLPTTQAQVDRQAKLSRASQCWLAAGIVTAIAARLERLAPKLIPAAVEVRDQLLQLQLSRGRDKGPFKTPWYKLSLLSEDAARGADLALVRAVNLGRLIGHTVAQRDDLGNLPYRVIGLHKGMQWVLWGLPAAWLYHDWHKRALRVASASDKREGGREGFGLGIPARLLDLNLPVSKASFAHDGASA